MRDLPACQPTTGHRRALGVNRWADLGMLLDLPPSTVDQMRDMAVFVPDPADG
jgi:hypothetical protein